VLPKNGLFPIVGPYKRRAAGKQVEALQLPAGRHCSVSEWPIGSTSEFWPLHSLGCRAAEEAGPKRSGSGGRAQAVRWGGGQLKSTCKRGSCWQARPHPRPAPARITNHRLKVIRGFKPVRILNVWVWPSFGKEEVAIVSNGL